MTSKRNGLNKALSVFLSVVLLLSLFPLSIFTVQAAAEEGLTRYVDPSTMELWRESFYPSADSFDTENAGGVWTDKSVFTDNTAFTALGIDGIANPSNRGFLTALSAIGSNMTITGESAVATDTVMVLDTSGSMKGAAAIAMVEAANMSIKTLMDANKHNRVGVVFYANSTVTFLPLDRYTTTTEDGIYLNSSTDGTSISLDRDVRNSAGGRPDTDSRSVVDGTYMAKGLHQALATFKDATLSQETTPRKPVIMFMTDGSPTRADTDFTNPPVSGWNDLGSGTSTNERIVFATELAAAYVKKEVTKLYSGTYDATSYDCLFYTLGMTGGDNSVYRECVLDPANKNTRALKEFWEDYVTAGPTDKVVIQEGPGNNNDVTVTKLKEPLLAENYVNGYFAAATEENLVEAFGKALADIALQTTYYPTLINDGDVQHSGYISFVDKLGRYMQVDTVNGLIIDNEWYSGSHFASAFNTGSLGTATNPTDLGNNLIWSIEQRLNIDADTARALINSAYLAGQLYYNSENDFSNYFGWYSDGNNIFLGFYSEGSTVPEGAVYTNKSYLYLGAENPETGIHASDMMYATVRVREKIATGEQEVNFAIPASLLPTVTYAVELNVNGEVAGLTTNADTVSPIRFVYSTKLDSRINKWTAGEIVDDVYTDYQSPTLQNNFTVNEDGSINFYNNKWSFDFEAGYGNYNPYSYFRPSKENDRYYFQYDKPIFTYSGGDVYTRYTGTERPSGDGYYYGTTVYYKDGTTVGKKTVYNPLHSDMMPATKQGADGWYMSESYLRRDYADVEFAKPLTVPDTGSETLPYYAKPYSDFSQGSGSASFNSPDHSLIVGVTLGNNGKIVLDAETGVKIKKELDTGVTAENREFIFEITTDNTALTDCEAYKLDADGQADTAVNKVTFSAGKATVKLKAGETLYVGGMKAGDTVTVKEIADTEYALKTLTVTNEGQVTPITGGIAQVQLDALDMPETLFVNGVREKGAVNVFKRIVHPYGATYEIPADKAFEIKLQLTFDGKPLAYYTLANGSTDENGVYTVNLAHDESRLVSGIPVGTVVTVTETPVSGFTATYNGAASHEGVTVTATTQNVEVVNTYSPTTVTGAAVAVSGTKKYSGNNRNWKAGDTYTFILQEYKNNTWENNIAEKTIKVETDRTDNDPIGFDFRTEFAAIEYTAPGTYLYRVVEKAGTIAGVHYDTRNHRFEVVVSDNAMTGALEITDVYVSQGNEQTVTVTKPTDTTYAVVTAFENGYNPADTVANIEIRKSVVNESGSPYATLDGFTFKLAQVSSFDETVDWDTVAAMSGATTTTGVLKHTITYTAAGTYYYKILEIVDAQKAQIGWTFDTTVRNVEVKVTDVGGALLATAYLQGQSANATSTVVVPFTNTYEPENTTVVIKDDPTDARVDFIRKNLTGRDMQAGEFTFYIYDSTNTLVATGKNEAAAAGQTAQVNFDKNLVFYAVGEYQFTVYEETANNLKPSVTYDKQVYTFTVTVTDSGEGYLTRTITVNDGIDNGNVITFTNRYDATDKPVTLTAKKDLEGKHLTANEFSFTIQECEADGTPKAGQPTVVYNDTDGNIVFPAVTYTQAGTTYYLVKEVIPSGEKLGIVYDETAYMAIVEITDDTANGVLKENVTYQKKAKNETSWTAADGIVFNNTYSATSAIVTFSGTKVVDGKELTENAYSFELYKTNAQWGEAKLEDTKANGAPDGEGFGHFTFGGVTLSAVGDYHFVVKEKIPATAEQEKGITYDETEYRITVTVTDNSRGQLVAEVTSIRTDSGVPHDAIAFTNAYAPVEGTSVTVNGDKTLDKADGTDVEFADFTFTFELYETDSSYATAGTPQTVDAAANGKFNFKLDYVPADLGKTFYYVIKEKNNAHGGVTYSQAEYRIKVEVLDELKDGVLETNVTATDKDGEPVTGDELAFINNYAITQGAILNLSGTKELEGRDMVADEFKFDLYASNAQHQIGADPLKSAYNEADGDFNFNNIALNKAGIHYFILKEDSSAAVVKAGVRYDTTAYLITVTVKDNKDGTLSADDPIYETLTEQGTESATALVFRNEYNAAATKPLNFSGKKVLNGRELAAGEFTFVLQETNEQFKALDGAQPLKTTNKADGTFEFAALTFEEIGTYYYVISEDATAKADRVTYDGTVYYVVITVTDDVANGKLVTAHQIKTDPAANATVTAVAFTNTYTPKPTDITVDFHIGKTVENKGSESITAEGFEFALEQIGGKNTLTVKTDKDGKAKFTLTFTENDIGKTYEYQLTEVNGNKPHVKYSSVAYTLTVTISLNDQNKLVATLTKDSVAADSITAEFVNEYDYTPPAEELPPIPDTGEVSTTYLWIALLFVSGGGLIGALVFGKKKNEDK